MITALENSAMVLHWNDDIWALMKNNNNVIMMMIINNDDEKK